MTGEASDRGYAADKDAAGDAVGFGDDIEAFVNAVVEIDVGATRGAEDDAAARSDAAARVSSQIVSAKVGLDFDNAALAVAMDEQFAEQSAGHFDSIAGVEAFWKGNQR